MLVFGIHCTHRLHVDLLVYWMWFKRWYFFPGNFSSKMAGRSSIVNQ